MAVFTISELITFLMVAASFPELHQRPERTVRKMEYNLEI